MKKRQTRLYKSDRVKRRICFREVICFLKLSTSVYTRLAAETHLADGVTVDREECLKLRGRIRIPVISKIDGQHFKNLRKQK
jgi:hypothetical protein